MDLPSFLMNAGYCRISLSRTGVGHSQTGGQLNGRAVTVLIDTGAASTVFSLELAHELGLRLQKASYQGGGAGAARLDIYLRRTRACRLRAFTCGPRCSWQ